MKLIFLILLFSCAEKFEKSELSTPVIKNYVRVAPEFPEGDIELDVLVAFLYPAQMSASESELVQKSINSGQSIRSKKTQFRKLLKINECKIKKKDCDCITDEDYCYEEIDRSTPQFQEDLLLCQKLLNEKNEINEDPSFVFGLTNIKDILDSFSNKALWIPTFIELDPNNIPLINITQSTFSLFSFGRDGDNYSTEDGSIYDFEYSATNLNFKIRGKGLFEGSILEATLNVIEKDSIIQATGDLTEYKEEKFFRDGVILFEILRPLEFDANCELRI